MGKRIAAAGGGIAARGRKPRTGLRCGMGGRQGGGAPRMRHACAGPAEGLARQRLDVRPRAMTCRTLP